MFSQLVNVVFPSLGRWFGLFAFLAEMSFQEFADLFLLIPNRFDSVPIVYYPNLFNGVNVPFVSPLYLYIRFLQTLNFNSLVSSVFYPVNVVIDFITEFTNGFTINVLSYSLNLIGLSTSTPVWVCMLAFSPMFCLLLGFLKHVLDAVPFF